MRDLYSVANECLMELEALNIHYGKIIDFEVNTRAKKRWGQCRKRPEGFYISISVYLLDDSTDINGLKNTIIHEILHTCYGCMNHGTEWKRLANIVNKAYGYNIKRAGSAEEKGCSCYEDKRTVKHKLICVNCKHEFIRYRESKFTRNPQNFRCGCGGEIEIIF